MTMDAAKRKKTKEQNQSREACGGLTRLWRGFRFYYRCFLVHYLLSLMTVSVLFCLGMGLVSLAADGAVAGLISLSVFDPGTGLSHSVKELSDAFKEPVMAAAVYFPTGASDVYFQDGAAVAPGYDNGERMSVFDAAGSPPEQPLAGREAVTGNGQGSAHGPTAELYRHPGKAPAGSLAVVPCDLSSSSRFTEANGGILFSNQSGYKLDAASLLSDNYPITAPAVSASAGASLEDDSAPLVLILHTHGTESYAPDGVVSVPKVFHARTETTDRNVVSVGRMLAGTLEEQGISVLHCETMFDRESYAESYEAAARYIKETVQTYPSIRYVFDVHRDALTDSDGSILRPVTEIDGEVVAQVMSVVGTNAAGASHDGWRDNLTVAVHLQKQLNEAYPAFARPINLRRATFNAQYAPGSLLLEIGSSGNSLEEARAAAYYLGLELGKLILQ